MSKIDEYDSAAVNALGVKYVSWYAENSATHLTKSGVKTLCGWWLGRTWRKTITDSVGSDVLCAKCVKSLNKMHLEAHKNAKAA